jgi:hypothetical protein
MAGLLLRFFLGYVCGLLIGPLLGGYYSKPGDVSIRCGIAGGLGSAGPFMLLTSVWAHEWSSLLTGHTTWASILGCILSVAVVEWIAGRPRVEAQEEIDPATIWRSSVRKSRVWFWLCLPAIVYSLWARFVGPLNLDGWPRYLIGLLAFVGFIGGLVSSALAGLRPSNK